MARGKNPTSTSATNARCRTTISPQLPFNWQKVDFAYAGVEYTSDEQVSQLEHQEKCCEDGICRCRRINNVKIEEIKPYNIAATVITSLQAAAADQKQSIKRFLHRKPGKHLQGETEEKIYDEYSKWREKVVAESKNKSSRAAIKRVYNFDASLLSREAMNRDFGQVDKIVLEQIFEEADLAADDFNIEISNGYYGEEVDGIYLDGSAKDKISEQLRDYLAVTKDDQEKIQWLLEHQGHNLNITNVSETKCQMKDFDQQVLEDAADKEKTKKLAKRFLGEKRLRKSKRSYSAEETRVIITPDSNNQEASYTILSGAEVVAAAKAANKRKIPVFLVQ